MTPNFYSPDAFLEDCVKLLICVSFIFTFSSFQPNMLYPLFDFHVVMALPPHLSFSAPPSLSTVNLTPCEQSEQGK